MTFAPKTYKIHCHVCGRDFDHEAEFLSTGASTADGRAIATCNIEPSLPKHSADEIRASYNARHGIPPVPGNGMAV